MPGDAPEDDGLPPMPSERIEDEDSPAFLAIKDAPNFSPGEKVRLTLGILKRQAPTPEGRSRIEDINLHFEGYAEPGYKDPKSGIIATGNWNSISHYDESLGKFVDDDTTPGLAFDLLTALGVEGEWEDEWMACYECSKLVRTQPNSYSWRPQYHVSDGDFRCANCIREDPAEYLEAFEGKTSNCTTISGIDPEDHGYVKLNDRSFENGFHPGQADDPRKIGAALRGMGITRFLFTLDSNGQFDLAFSVYVHESEVENFDAEEWAAADLRMHPEPAERLRAALMGLSEARRQRESEAPQ